MFTHEPVPQLATLLSAGGCLVVSKPSQPSPRLKDVLQSRLAEFHRHMGHTVHAKEHDTLEEVELETANQALYVVEHVQRLLVKASDDTGFGQADDSTTSVHQSETQTADVPIIGTRDLAQIRTLLSIVFKWGTEPIISRLASRCSDKHVSSVQSSHEIIDLTTTPDDLNLLTSFLARLASILFPSGMQNSVSQTLIATTILNRHIVDVLTPSVSLGWLPNSLTSRFIFALEDHRRFVIRLLAILPASQTIIALGTILSGKPPPPRYVHRTCASFLSKQLLRPEGVRGLCYAIFDEVEEVHAPLDKLVQVARILCTVPAAMNPEAYFRSIFPRIMNLLSEPAPLSHKRAAAFALARMLVNNGSPLHHQLLSSIILPIFHKSFLDVTIDNQSDNEQFDHTDTSTASTGVQFLSASQSLSTLLIVLTNTDPSPPLISALLSPILPALYNALFRLDDRRTSDPQLKESLRGILETWGRVVTFEEATNGLWDILANEGGEWEVDALGELKRVAQPSSLPSLSLLTPEDFAAGGKLQEGDLDLNLFNIRPDPIHFVRFIKSLGRSDVASDILVRLLEAYRQAKAEPDGDPMRILLFLQTIMQMQEQLSGEDGSPSIFQKPEHILFFAKHVLESVTVVPPDLKLQQDVKPRVGLRIEDLRFIKTDDQLADENKSDNEVASPALAPDIEMIETTINLLLSILEANPTLPPPTMAILNDIFSLLLRIGHEDSPPVQKLVQEARLVITARLASASTPHNASPKYTASEDSKATYQRALKLLQDPILPVRAHGLLLLRQLVSKSDRDGVVVDQALVPAILSIFLQSVEQDDSYMFLNAVQGLAAMVDAFGKEVLKALISVYSKGLDELSVSNITQHEVDTRLRVGEALAQVIRRCGEALTIYIDTLVPPIFTIVRSSRVPTTLRTSSLSLLADCGNASILSLIPYSNDLFEAMIDLLQVESVSTTARKQASSEDGSCEEIQVEETIDSRPTSASSKFPSLRRAALHFLSLLLRAIAAQAVDSRSTLSAFSINVKRANVTLLYVASTDQDMVVRVMAQEAAEDLKQLSQTVIGL